jgi:hypothetical protein
MRRFDYARTTPETREGFPVFVVLAEVIMARDHRGGEVARQRLLAGLTA